MRARIKKCVDAFQAKRLEDSMERAMAMGWGDDGIGNDDIGGGTVIVFMGQSGMGEQMRPLRARDALRRNVGRCSFVEQQRAAAAAHA